MFRTPAILLFSFYSLFCLIHTKRKECRDFIQTNRNPNFFQNSSGATIDVCGCINRLNILNKAKI
jgi:hypothetical protein